MLKHFLEVRAFVDVAHVDALPVAAVNGDAIGQLFAVGAERLAGDGGGAVVAQGIGIEDSFGFAVELFFQVEDGLVLQTVVFPVEVAVALFGRHAILRVVPEHCQPAVDVGTRRHAGEKGFRSGHSGRR